jgi:primosomal protein N'
VRFPGWEILRMDTETVTATGPTKQCAADSPGAGPIPVGTQWWQKGVGL